MAALATTVVPHLGLDIPSALVTPSVGGDDCATGPGVVLVVQNTDAAAQTVQLATPQVVDGDLAVPDRTITVAATTGLMAIPLVDLYRDPATGRAALTYPGGITGLKVAVIRVATS
ncbi:hypothetical protein AB0M87_04430 [Streptomyces sp. NPDC051320]|uniref:hypothetical protein n=1 Tax=Streptomyces sp. NPDC051320 TaxID=3154644 RepID=UPI0034233EA3